MKNRKKILLYTRPLVPPWDEASKNLAFEIARNSKGSFEFNLLTSGKYSKELLASIPKNKNKKIVAEDFYKNADFDEKAKRRLLLRLLRPNLSADIMHMLFTPRALTSSLIRSRLLFSKTRTIQTIATIGDELLKDRKRLEKTLFADQIVAQSKHTKGKLQRVGIENVQTIYPGIDLKKFSPQEKDEKIMRQLRISRDDFVILFAGEYVRLEALDDVVSAFDLLFDENSDEEKNYKLVLALRIKSDEDLQKKHETIELLEEKGLDDKVIFLDMCHEMPALYNISDVNIFPARKMAGKFDIPFVIIEAMACGKPVIVSDLPVLREFVEDGKTGLVAKKADPFDLMEKIKLLKTDDDLRKKISAAALEYAGENFDIKKNVKFYDELYEKI